MWHSSLVYWRFHRINILNFGYCIYMIGTIFQSHTLCHACHDLVNLILRVTHPFPSLANYPPALCLGYSCSCMFMHAYLLSFSVFPSSHAPSRAIYNCQKQGKRKWVSVPWLCHTCKSSVDTYVKICFCVWRVQAFKCTDEIAPLVYSYLVNLSSAYIWGICVTGMANLAGERRILFLTFSYIYILTVYCIYMIFL